MITFALMCNAIQCDWSHATCHNITKGNASFSEIKSILFSGSCSKGIYLNFTYYGISQELFDLTMTALAKLFIFIFLYVWL